VPSLLDVQLPNSLWYSTSSELFVSTFSKFCLSIISRQFSTWLMTWPTKCSKWRTTWPKKWSHKMLVYGNSSIRQDRNMYQKATINGWNAIMQSCNTLQCMCQQKRYSLQSAISSTFINRQCCWMGGRKGIRLVKTEWWDAGVVMCLGQGANLHIAQLMSLPLTISCSSKSRLVWPSWFYLSGASSPG